MQTHFKTNIIKNTFLIFSLFSLFILSLQSCSPSCKKTTLVEDKKEVTTIQKNIIVKAEKQKAKAIDNYFSRINKIGVFNGNVLVAQKSKIIFQKSYGYRDVRTKEPLKLNSVFQLGSVSKQFTAVAILQLYEHGKLDLQDTVQKFISNFPYKGITIHMLLCHRSGLMNYIYYCDANYHHKEEKPLSNKMVIQCLIDSFPAPYFSPNRRFNYSNTGYMLLARIVEIVSKKNFEDYMKINLFEPLSMKSTYVFNLNRPYKSPYLVKGYEYGRIEANPDFLDGVVGDKGVYSNLYDLYLWDQALYKNIVIKRNTLELAFKPYGKNLRAHKNYGYGFRMYYRPDSTRVIYHAGWWHGYQSLLVRYEKDSTTIVVLKNKRNRLVIDQEKILDILASDSTDFLKQ